MKFASKFSLICILFLMVLLLRSPLKAYAHFPETSGSLTAILHVEPDDYPSAGKPETIYFIFSDLSNHFKLANCNCNLAISQAGQALYYSPLSAPPAGQPTIYGTAGIPFTFRNPRAYQIKLTGQPLTAGAFKAFDLNWNFQVAQSLKPAQSFSARTFLAYFLLILGVLLFIGIIIFVFA